MLQMQQTQNFLLKNIMSQAWVPLTSPESKPISSPNVLNEACPNPSSMFHFLFMNIAHLISKTKQKLIKLQNKILKIITLSHRFINKEQLYAHSGILPFSSLVKHRIGLLMYKLSNGNIPKPLLNIYKSNKDFYTHFTRQANHFRSRRGNT